MFDRENENYIYELVSKNIKKQRKLQGLTQEQLANKMAYSTQFISNIESKNHQTFSLGTLWRLSLVLNIDIKVLFDESVMDEKEKTYKENQEKKNNKEVN